jgi:hypothetical protein
VRIQVPISFHAFTPPELPLAESLHLSLVAVGGELSRNRVVTPTLARPGVEQTLPSEWRKKLSAGFGVIVPSKPELWPPEP